MDDKETQCYYCRKLIYAYHMCSWYSEKTGELLLKWEPGATFKLSMAYEMNKLLLQGGKRNNKRREFELIESKYCTYMFTKEMKEYAMAILKNFEPYHDSLFFMLTMYYRAKELDPVQYNHPSLWIDFNTRTVKQSFIQRNDFLYMYTTNDVPDFADWIILILYGPAPRWNASMDLHLTPSPRRVYRTRANAKRMKVEDPPGPSIIQSSIKNTIRSPREPYILVHRGEVNFLETTFHHLGKIWKCIVKDAMIPRDIKHQLHRCIQSCYMRKLAAQAEGGGVEFEEQDRIEYEKKEHEQELNEYFHLVNVDINENELKQIELSVEVCSQIL